MSLSETRTFLEELVLKYDPDADLAAGSRAQVDLIEPILERVGIDPFDEDIHVFVRERVRQAFPDLAITEADELTDTLIDPMRVLFEPLVREVKLVKLRASLRNQASLSDDEVDALMGNFFEARRSGGFAVGVVRAYFSTPQTISITQTQPASTRSGLRFYPTRPQQITADQMRLNPEGSEYYFDINYTSENRGSEYNVEPNEIVSVANLPTATRVRNIRRFRGGTARENNNEYTARVERSLSDRTLTVSRGITSTLFENFPALRRLFVVGFRDPEMERDVIKGGGLGPVPADDTFGEFFGSAAVSDDLDGDLTSPIISAATGNFVARLGAVGTVPSGWYVTLVYTYLGSIVVVDTPALEVLSSTLLRVEQELPVTGVTNFVWMLRRRELTVSDIPGGVTLPDTATGELVIRTDEVHIGGKTDVYAAGETEEGTASISFLSDEEPIARGINAETAGTDIVILNDIVNPEDVAPGMSLLLEEGSDAGSYLIIEVLTGPDRVRLSVSMTGTQANLSYRIIDEIDVELTDPKTVKVSGSDLITAAGVDTVNTASATNFLDVNVQEGDILEVIATPGGGEFTVVEVGALFLRVTPALPRTLPGAAYRVFTRWEAVQAPVVRVRNMELVDSAGAPTGTLIPYRDPVLVLSNAFQNEGSGFPFDNAVVAGLVTVGVAASPGFVALGGTTLNIDIYDPEDVWAGVDASVSITFSAGPNLTAAQVVTEINASVAFSAQGIRATEITYNSQRYVGLVCARHLRVTGGTSLAILGWAAGRSNSDVVSMDPVDTLQGSKARRTDLMEFLSGNNTGLVARLITEPDPVTGITVLGSGPLGPEGSSRLYYNTSLKPDVGARARAGRPSVGSARVFFLSPTSAEFDFRTTGFTAVVGNSTLGYIPDPENTRVVLPVYPRTDLVGTGLTGFQSLTDTTQNFLLQRIQPGDVVEILYRPITSTAPLPAIVATAGLVLVLKLDADPFITISFPFVTMSRQDVVDYINTRVGEEIASLDGANQLVLSGSRRIEIDATASAAAVAALFISTYTTDHPERGEYIVLDVGVTLLTFSPDTPIIGATANTFYRIKRYVQRISSTEMNLNKDASGLYYVDVQMVSLAPGDLNNIGSGVEMEVAGHRSDGYRLSTDNSATSYSRAEILRAQISPSMLLVGSSDSPEEYVQLAQQSIQVAYDRSQLVDEIQSFSDSDFQRVVCEEILVRHLLPHYVSLTWSYAAGSSEAEMLRVLSELLDAIEPGDEFEVSDMVNALRRKGATSVFTPDASSSSGRSAPLFVVVHHERDRRVRALIVKDFVDTNRTQRFIPDNITLRRISPGGIR